MNLPIPSSDAPLARESLSVQAYQRLRNDLMSGRYLPGQKLKLRDLAAEFGVSPTPVREAMARLVSEMALEQHDHRSVHVPRMSVERFIEIRDLRYDIEGRAAACAAERATDGDIAELDAIHEHLIALKNTREIKASIAENQRFHARLCAIAGLPLHYRILEGLWLQLGPLMNALLQWRPTPLPTRHPHRVILDGLRRHEPDLARSGVQEDIVVNTEPLLHYLRNGNDAVVADLDGQPARAVAAG